MAVLLVALLLFCSPTPAGAKSLVESRAVWQDISTNADFTTAREQTYTLFGSVFTGGYTTAVHWIRIRVAASQEKNLLLRVRPQYLDEIQLYDPAHPDADGVVRPRLSGDTYPVSEPTLMSTNHLFTLPGSTEPRDVWLRLKSTTTHLLQVDVQPFTSALNTEHWQLLIQALLFGSYALSSIWAVADWAGRRDPIMLLFAGKQMVLTIQVFFFTGLARLLLDGALTPQEISHATNIMNVLAVLTGFFFELKFLGEFHPPRWLYRVAWAFWFPSLLALGMVLSGHHQLALKINSMLLLIMGFLSLGLAYSGRAWSMASPDSKPLIPRFWLRTFYSMVCVATSFTAAAFLDITEAGEWSLISSLAYGLLSGVLIIGLLQMRANRLMRSQRDREERLRSAEAIARAERVRREEQSRFIAMLTHELKTPLSVIRMTLGAPDDGTRAAMMADARRAVVDMLAVIDRCVQADRIEEGARAYQPTAVDLNAILEQVTQDAGVEHIRIRSNGPCGLLHTDPTILKIILANLVDNALKYRLSDSKIDIDIDAECQQDGVKISVSNAPGVAGWPDAKRLFEKYYRSQGAHRETGSGLGLYLVSMLVRLAGGTIRYTPSDTLVRFELWIPRSISSSLKITASSAA